MNQLEYRDKTEIKKTHTHTYNQSQRLDVKREPRMRRTQPPAWTMRKRRRRINELIEDKLIKKENQHVL